MRQACVALVLALALAALGTLGAVAPGQAQTPPLVKSAGPSFPAVDANRDGRLSLDEVLAYARKASAEVQPFRIVDADLDHDGMLSVEEQRGAGLTGLSQFGAVDLRAMDRNGDGYISREDLDEYFRTRHREAHARADTDHDGSLKPSEFVLFHF